MPSRLLAVAVLTAAGLTPPAVAGATTTSPAPPDRYIVVLQDAVASPGAVAREHAAATGATFRHVYSHALKGYSASIPPARLAQLRRDRRVAYVTPDIQGEPFGKPVSQPAQAVPTGVKRINLPVGAPETATNADVAVIDSGVDATHPDLNVVGGFWCGENRPDGYGTDKSGHGTHVAGTVAARNNGIGVLGVAPGARLWSYRVPDRHGRYYLSAVACAVDRITELRKSGTANIAAANISLGWQPVHNGWPGYANDDCGAANNDPLHKAICASRAVGTTYVAAAGNGTTDAQTIIPAGYDEVITVSALADFDGLTGGEIGTTTNPPYCRVDEDDTAASFSNNGLDVDLIAPGVCIRSTTVGGGYGLKSGTSMAAPHVTGAAAVVAANSPGATPDAISAHLTSNGTKDYTWGAWGTHVGDPDGVQEPLLNGQALLTLPVSSAP